MNIASVMHIIFFSGLGPTLQLFLKLLILSAILYQLKIIQIRFKRFKLIGKGILSVKSNAVTEFNFC